MLPNAVMVVCMYINFGNYRYVQLRKLISIACSGEFIGKPKLIINYSPGKLIVDFFVHSSIPVSKLSLCVCIVPILTLAAWLSLSPLSPDPTLTVASVTAVMESVGDWYGLGLWLDVPRPVRDVIRGSHRGDRECKTALAEYFVSSVPGASWTTLAGALYHKEESAALLAVGRHLKEEKGWWGNVIC